WIAKKTEGGPRHPLGCHLPTYCQPCWALGPDALFNTLSDLQPEKKFVQTNTDLKNCEPAHLCKPQRFRAAAPEIGYRPEETLETYLKMFRLYSSGRHPSR
ncbi:hypothetical protein, partial [endosymbiont of Riftia pachyptila]|uniref:hypothetical protein n=1 Tax=endosymbiont of Riftia pachyptila TaxID=54396 RepID=UPI001F11D633